MIPKKPKEVIKHIAEEFDLPQSTVDDIVSFYYKELRKTLSSLEHLKVNVKGLGDFIVLQKSVNRLSNKYNTLSTQYNTDTFKNYHNLKLVESKLERLNCISKKITTYLETKKQFKDVRKSKTNMEKPEANS